MLGKKRTNCILIINILKQYFIMTRCGHTTFLTDFSITYLSTGQSSSYSKPRPPRQSSFLNRLKTNTKNRMTKYNLKEKRGSSTGSNFYKSYNKSRSLIKMQQSMNQLKLNITNVVPTFRKLDISKVFYTPRKNQTPLEKPQRASSRVMYRSSTPLNDHENFQTEIIKTVPKKTSDPLFLRKVVKKQILYQQFYGDPKQGKIQDINKIQNRYFKDFIWKVAYTNGHILEVKQKPRVFIGKGNNSKLLQSVMRSRWWWILQKDQNKADFIWTQLKIPSIYTTQKSCNTMADTYNDPKTVFSVIIKGDPALQLMNPHQFASWNSYLKAFLKQQKKIDENLTSRKGLTKNLPSLTLSKVTNHLEFSRMLGNKKALFYTMRQYYQITNKDYTQYLPMTFHIVSGTEDEQYTNFLKIYSQRRKKAQPNIWIVKPGEMSNRGNGIKVCNSLEEVKTIIKSKNRHNNGKIKTYIVQLYMSSPFLYKNRKFDIRHYIMITSVNGLIKGYWYQDGYIRTTSYEFNLLNLNGLVHLTNDAVQKYGKDYGKFQKGNKISYQQFQVYIDTKYGQGYYNFQDILQKMKSIATDVIRASFLNVDPKRREHNFQIFGMDFMISRQFKPYLIEINTNPCLQLSSPLLSKLIPSMVDNALRIGLDPLFPPPVSANKKMNLSPNKFQMIFDQVTEKQSLKELYGGHRRICEILEDIGSDDQAYEDIQQNQN